MDIRIIPVTGAPDPNTVIIYRPLAGRAFVGNRAMAKLVQALTDDVTDPKPHAGPEILEFLFSSGFLDPDPPPPVWLRTDFNPTTAVLLLTNQCQLRCTYCYAAAGEAPHQELTPELGYAAIDYVCERAMAAGLPEFEVSFHGGGEPTYAWRVLQSCTDYARQKPIKAKVTLTSNGVWSEAQCAWIAANLDGLSLSVDGAPATQDRQRPLRTGRGSSPYVLRTIAALDRHAFPYGIRLTATAPWTLADDVRFLCTETGCQSMQVEPAFNTKRGGHNEPDAAEIEGFVTAFLDAFEIAQQAGRRLLYSGARVGLATTIFCSAPYNALIVNANGDLVACYEVASDAHPLAEMSVIGRVVGGQVVIDHATRDHLHRLIDERRATCTDCFCYWSCAGDCYPRTFEPGEAGHLQHKGRCTINRQISEKLLLRRIADGGGVWRAPGVSRQDGPCSPPAQD